MTAAGAAGLVLLLLVVVLLARRRARRRADTMGSIVDLLGQEERWKGGRWKVGDRWI